MNFLKSLGPAITKRLKNAFYFRPEDPNDLLQITPARWPTPGVDRIKGFRYPAPGSRTTARIPLRESEEEIYDINFYVKNPRNLKTGATFYLNTTEKNIALPQETPNLPVQYKRKINLLPYDPSGLRTTKTTTWQAVQPVLMKHAQPNHLPRPAWYDDIKEIEAEREKKGLPPPIGKRYKFKAVTDNYNVVRW